MGFLSQFIILDDAMKRLIYLFFACMCFGTESALLGMISRVPVSKTGVTSNKSAYISIRQIHPAMLKGADCGETSISPVTGALMIESQFIKNLFIFGDQQSPTVRLLRDIFYMQDGLLSPTVNYSKPAASLTVPLIANLQQVAYGKFSTKSANDLIAQWRANHQQITQAKLSYSRIQRFLDLVMSAAFESRNGNTLPDMVPMLISAFAMEKSRIPDDVKMYLAALGKDVQVATYPGTLYEDFESELYKNFINRSKMTKLLDEQRFGTAASALMVRKNYASKYVPPAVDRTIRCGFKGQEARPTCQEGSIRDLINILIYNPEKQSYDLTCLPHQKIIHPTLAAFYTDNPTTVEQNTHTVGQQWMDIVSGLPNVSYELGEGDRKYELSATTDTVFAVLNHLLCSDTAKDWDDLSKKLSDAQRTITFATKLDVSEELTSEGVITIHVQSSQPGIPAITAHLHASGAHGTLEVPLRVQGNEIITKKPVYTWDLYGALLRRTMNKPTLFEKLFSPNSDPVRTTRALVLLPFVRALAFDHAQREGLQTIITQEEERCFGDASFAYQQYYLLARPLVTSEQRARVVADGCALLKPDSTDLAAQITRIIDASIDSFDGCEKILYGVVRRYAGAIVQHDALADAIGRCVIALHDHASTAREKSHAQELLKFYRESALGKHQSAEKVIEKIKSSITEKPL